MTFWQHNTTILWLFLFALTALIVRPANAAFINFDNCLNENILNSRNPQQLQFVPLFFDARFDTGDPSHNLNITIYGNVTGQAFKGDYPPPDSPSWANKTDPFGKIMDSTVNFTTLFTTYDVLTYTPYSAQPTEFCNLTVGGTCPLGPLFSANASDPHQLHAFAVSHNFFSSYAFASIVPTIKVRSGDTTAQFLACVTASITPDLGDSLAAALRFLPAAILALVGIATISAARLSPWSSSNFFYWSSNYGRDEDILRLVTPGFGDCLQYIQFIVLAGSLSLNYPGYFQPVVSQSSWSILMFNESLVSQGPGTQSLFDGIYSTNSSYGLTRMSQLAGMTKEQDIWAGMAVWACVIIGIVIILCQVGFALNWFARQMYDTPQEDLRSKNFPFTGGNIVRIVFNYFLLPIVSLSMFQLVVSSTSPSYVVALAVIGLVAIFSFTVWAFKLIFTTRPRVHLFDHLPLLLLYGPLYNTYSDEATPFAIVPILLTVVRGVAIGAIQPSGIAQLVILAICEVIMILTLHAFRPFQSSTSMNAFHTFFAIIRLVTTLLSVAFVPSLGVAESAKGWIGYAILLLHAIVLVFGFFLNALMTIIEVFARALGGKDERGGLTKVFGVRQLSKRNRLNAGRNSLASEAAILTNDSEAKSKRRSGSATSAIVLNGPGTRGSGLFEHMSTEAGSQRSAPSAGPSTPGGGQSPFSFVGGGMGSRKSTFVSKGMEPPDPYYRPPRPRRATLEPLTGRSASMGSEGEAVAAEIGAQQAPSLRDVGEGPSGFSPSRGSGIAIPHFRHFRDDSESNLSDRRITTDYTTRESDFYYGLRGPALSSMPNRRRKTGPADPMSPVASATGWFKNIFVGKRKEKGKGFEVVRSTPLHLLPMEEEDETVHNEPYRDNPVHATQGMTSAGAERESPTDETAKGSEGSGPPTLGPVETGSFHIPSRMTSQRSEQPPLVDSGPPVPGLPRRSSKRLSHTSDTLHPPPPMPQPSNHIRQQSFPRPGQQAPPQAADTRVPFNTEPSPSPERRSGYSRASSSYPASEEALEMQEASGYANRPPVAAPLEQPSGTALAPSQRPVSTGHVLHHLASESIHPGYYETSKHLGSRAEVIGGPPPPRR